MKICDVLKNQAFTTSKTNIRLQTTMIDTHCHLDNKQFDNDRPATIERAFEGGMTHLMIPAIEPARFQAVLGLAASDERIFCGMGIHPHHASEASDEALGNVEDLSHGTKVRAIGEIGLDYHYDFAPRDVQQKAFRAQLRIAKHRNLPVIVHNRESDDDLFRILDDEQDGSLRGVLHCFSGTPEQAERAVNLGFHVSFTGNITFKTSTLSETVSSVPMDKLMIETDAPYMAPVPHRGKRNEPAFVRLVAEKIADLRGLSLETVLATTSGTAQRFFNITAILFAFFLASMLLAPMLAFGQLTDDEDDDKPVPFVNPFPKTIGFGGTVGALTLVDLANNTTFSYPGTAIIGGGNIRYYFNDGIALDAGYYAGENFAPTRVIPGAPPPQMYPDRFQTIDLAFHFTANAGNIVNFCFGFGGSYTMLTPNAGPNAVSDNQFGFNGKLVSLCLNLPTPLGIFYPGFEWHINGVFFLNRQKTYTGPMDIRTQYGFVYSVPRFNLYWFPTFGAAK